jgi:branched-chain amino acid transport system substrate-binding protein
VDALELVSKLLTQQPPPLAEVAPQLAAHVAAAVTRALAKNKDDRFESMTALIEALAGPVDALAPTLHGFVPGERRAGANAPNVVRDPPVVASSSGSKGERAPAHAASRRWMTFALIAIGVGAGAYGVRAMWQRSSAPVPPTSASSIASSAPRECTASTECVKKNGGKPAVCNPSGRCAPIESEDCRAMFEPGDLERDDTIWIGAMFPTSGDGASYGKFEMNAVELGRRDFAAAMNGFRAPPKTATVHPLAVVACDDTVDPARAARHLVDDVGVPAVIGFRSSVETIELATSLFIPSDVMSIASVSQSPALAGLPHGPDQPRMVWRTTYSNAAVARAIAAMIERLEGELRARRAIAATEKMRVAVTRLKHPSATPFAEALFGAIRFNSSTALENGKAYREIAIATEDERKDYARVAAELVSFRPHVIVFASDRDLLDRVESAWSKDIARPTYVTNTAFPPDLVAFVAASTERRQRLFGATSVGTTTPNARLVLHYNQTFAPPVTRARAPNSSYDAFYVVAYASYAVGAERVDGRSLSRAVARLVPPGAAIDVGPSGILTAFGALRRGESVDLNGTVGKLDFDLKTGEAPVDFAIVCTELDEHGTPIGSIESGLVYDDDKSRLEGQMRCR